MDPRKLFRLPDTQGWEKQVAVAIYPLVKKPRIWHYKLSREQVLLATVARKVVNSDRLSERKRLSNARFPAEGRLKHLKHQITRLSSCVDRIVGGGNGRQS